MLQNSRAGRLQRGNILFLILLAVVLFAALSYAVKSSMRGGGKDGGSESAKLLASEILNMATLYESELQRFMLMTGLDVGQIDLNYSGFSGAGSGAVDDCSDFACNLFREEGGNVTRLLYPKAAMDPNVTSHINAKGEGLHIFRIVSVKNVGTEEPELVMERTGLTHAVCDAINEMVGIWRPGDPDISNSLGSSGTGWTDYSGDVYPVWPTTTEGQMGNTDTRLIGQRTFCYTKTATAGRFLHVLVPK